MIVGVNDSQWFNTHTSRHDQYSFVAVLPELPVYQGERGPGLSAAAGLRLRK